MESSRVAAHYRPQALDGERYIGGRLSALDGELDRNVVPGRV